MKQKVIIASKNPVKIKAVELGFEKMLGKEFEFIGSEVESGVSDQPMTNQETQLGATNRVVAVKTKHPEADFWVGVEGGLEVSNGHMEAFCWIEIEGKNGKKSGAKTATFRLPNKIRDLIGEGLELGHASDKVFGTHNVKQKSGSIGLLTDDLIDRTKYYEHAVIMALIPFKNSHLY